MQWALCGGVGWSAKLSKREEANWRQKIKQRLREKREMSDFDLVICDTTSQQARMKTLIFLILAFEKWLIGQK